MSVSMRWGQCCESEGCKRPARHGALCNACWLAATPARRAVEQFVARCIDDASSEELDDYVSADGAAWLEELWAA
jgi:hypothetical protein